MEFSIDERRVILVLLSEVMKADEIIRPEEENCLTSITDSLGTTNEDLDHLDSMDWNKALAAFSKMTKEKRAVAIKMCKDMAMADNDYDKRERFLIDQLVEWQFRLYSL
jgi:uncharacterized tellurite resistance protein B-like protein